MARPGYLSRLILIMAICWLGSAAAVRAAGPQETWDVLLLQRSRIGYSHATVIDTMTAGERVIVADVISEMTVKRNGQSLTTSMTLHSEESPDGTLRRFKSVLRNPPNSFLETSGVVVGDELRLTIKSAERTIEQTIPQAGQLKSGSYIDRSLKHHGLDVGESVELRTFDPQLAKVVTIKVRRLPAEETTLLENVIRKADRMELTNSAIPGLVTIVYFDPESDRQLKIGVPLVGMESVAANREVALEAFDAYDQLQASLIPLETDGNLNAARSVTFRLQIEGIIDPDLFPNGPAQTVTRESNGALLITSRKCGPASSIAESTASEPEVAYLEPSRFIECRAPLIHELSLKGRGNAQDSALRAAALEQFVHRYITRRNLATAMGTALEVAHSKSGDCTEHAVLLTALLRSADIPARVVMGIVYVPSERGFIGHMWTEAWIKGAWIPLDATRAAEGINGSYIKLTDSALSGEGALPGAEFLPLVAIQGRTKVEIVSIEN